MKKNSLNIEELNKQRPHWENILSENPDLFGDSPSEPAVDAVKIFKKQGLNNIIELGGGQGRDTIYFARNGFNVTVLEYTAAGVEIINKKASELGLTDLITVKSFDVRKQLPFKDETFDACYSHMLFCMALTNQELEMICAEIHRILKKDGLNFYTVRNTKDSHYEKGKHKGEDMYEMNGFIVHFFDEKKIQELAKEFSILSISEFNEGELPRKLYQVVMKKQ